MLKKDELDVIHQSKRAKLEEKKNSEPITPGKKLETETKTPSKRSK